MNKQQLAAKIWESANKLRSKIEANEYKDYILGFIFYKFLSDQEEQKLRKDGWGDEDLKELTEDDSTTVSYCQKDLGYFIAYKDLFSTWLAKGKDFSVADVTDALSAFNRLIGFTYKKVFEKIFDTLDTGLSKLGDTSGARTKAISNLIQLIKDIPMDGKEDYDVLGFIYEYLISNFAANAGKKAGEFYTPTGPAKILTQIAIDGQEDKRGLLVYDPCMGSASLLLDARNFSKRPQYIKYFGQELMNSTYNIARMNMLLHGIAPENQNLNLGDTLDDDWPAGEDTEFDMVVMNPPYSAKWSAKEGFKTDPRFSGRDDLAPKSKADYAFLLHGLYHLKSGGTMGIVLPHGVLFRGGSEGKIRRSLLKDGNIYAIIGLPANMFYNTSIPTCIIILKKERDDKSDAPSGESGGESENADSRDVLFIDASKLFEKKKTQNVMNDEHIKRVIELYKNRQDVDKEAHLASFAEIEENDFNLNIPRYVDTTEDEEPVRLADVNSQIAALDGEMEAERAQMLQILGSLEPLEQSVDSSSGSRVGESETREQTETHEQTLAALKEFMNRIEQL